METIIKLNLMQYKLQDKTNHSKKQSNKPRQVMEKYVKLKNVTLSNAFMPQIAFTFVYIILYKNFLFL